MPVRGKEKDFVVNLLCIDKNRKKEVKKNE